MLEVRCNVTETGLEVREPRGEKKKYKNTVLGGGKKKKKTGSLPQFGLVFLFYILESRNFIIQLFVMSRIGMVSGFL